MARSGGGCCPSMDLMRSEAMQLLQVIIPTESAHLAVSHLGDLGLIQFKDVSPSYSPAVDFSYLAGLGGGSAWCLLFGWFRWRIWQGVHRWHCEFGELKLSCGAVTRDCSTQTTARFNARMLPRSKGVLKWPAGMLKAGIQISLMQSTEASLDFDDMEIKLGELEAELTEVNANDEKLQRTCNELLEYSTVLQQAGEFFYSAQRSAAAQQRQLESNQSGQTSLESPLLEQDMLTDASKHVKLGSLSGLVPKEKAMDFERILFRATIGNILLRQEC